MKVIGIVPAAGIGSRMLQSTPKQYSKILDKTVLEHSVLSLLADPRVSEVYVTLHPKDNTYHTLPIAEHNQVTSLIGGHERFDSVWNALTQASQKYSDNTLVVVHDAARPGLTKEFLAHLIDQAYLFPEQGVLAAIPAWDTMKQVSSEGIETLNRDVLWHAFTPQIFNLGNLIQAFIKAKETQSLVTDESSAIELLGFVPILIEAPQQLRKITCQEDLVIIKALLENNSQRK